jgi:hypothetical protein
MRTSRLHVSLWIKTHEPSIRRCLLLTVFFSIPAWLCFNKTSVVDADIWWHLRTGQWIAEHHSVPFTDWFSSYGTGKFWAAYSWLFEIVVNQLFRQFGLIALVIYVYVLMLAITITFFLLVRLFEKRRAQSILIAGAGVLALAQMRTPRPWLFTILFFAIELYVLVRVRRSHHYRHLFYLAPLFTLWANLHIQFVYGLAVLGLAALEGPLDRLIKRRTSQETTDCPVPFSKMSVVLAACVLASFVNPYHVRIYAVILDTMRQGGLYQLISELAAPDFRSLSEWLVLALTMGAVFALGRRPQLASFWYLLLAISVFVAFRAKRDVWMVITVAIALIPMSVNATVVRGADHISRAQAAAVLVACVVLLPVAFALSGVSNQTLQIAVAKEYPVKACEFVEKGGFSGPLYNHFDWGGYLIWRLPNLPVSIDGRSNVHDSERIRRSAEVWNGHSGWASNPELTAARLIIAQKNLPLTQLLRTDPRFQITYEDDLSVVFVAAERLK